jgi:hypothetical protein
MINLLQGDCLEQMKQLEDNHLGNFHLTFNLGVLHLT